MENVLVFAPVERVARVELPSPRSAPATAPRADSGPGSGWQTGSVGPDLPPLTNGLIHTPIERLRSMFAYCLVRGLMDQDTEWVNDPAFLVVCEYAGLQGATPERVRDLYNSGKLDFKRLQYAMCGWGSTDEKAVA